MNFEIEPENIEKLDKQKERPSILYHGSSTEGLEEVAPQQQNVRDKNEGARVFATPDKALATVFMAKGPNNIRMSGLINGVPYAVIPRNREEFLTDDHGGIIYEFPAESFENDPVKGLGYYEWTSQVPVAPTNGKNYESVLDAMLESGVQVYFVDSSTYNELENGDKLNILQNIESENQKRSINVKKF